MAPNDSAGHRRAARYAIPVAVAGVAAATIGLVPALAASGDPELPEITARQLIERIAASDVQQLSGTVKVTTDLGIPSLGGLVDSGTGGSADPRSKLTELASGTHTLRIAADGPERQRLTFVDDAAEYSLVRDGNEVWAYDSGSNEALRMGGGPAGEDAPDAPGASGVPATPKDFADRALKAVDGTTSVTVDGTARIAGRDAYQLVIKPKQSGSTVGAITVAVDAEKGVPLKFTLTPSGGGRAVVDAGFTKVDFARPAASVFDFAPPKGAKVTEAGPESGPEGKPEKHVPSLPGLPGGGSEGLNVIGEGWTAVAELSGPAGVPAEGGQFLDALGDKVTGDFGSGTVFRTRLVNALLTENGKVYVGAVTPEALVTAANSAR